MRDRLGLRGWTILWLVTGCVTAGAETVSDAFRGEGLCLFKLHDYELKPHTEQAINQVATNSLREQSRAFGFEISPDFRVRIRIFGGQKAFESYTLSQSPLGAERTKAALGQHLRGYYSAESREVVTWRQLQPDLLANVILHEASHAILHSQYRRIPIWLSEGSATYFAFPFELRDDHDMDSLKYRWALLNIWFRQRQLPEIKTMFEWSPADFHRLDPTKAYTASWSLFQLMMSTEPRRAIMREWLEELQKRRRRSMAGAAVMEKLYPGGLAQLQLDWHGWIVGVGGQVLGPEMEEILKRIKQ